MGKYLRRGWLGGVLVLGVVAGCRSHHGSTDCGCGQNGGQPPVVGPLQPKPAIAPGAIVPGSVPSGTPMPSSAYPGSSSYPSSPSYPPAGMNSMPVGTGVR
jgi:hypothetical protein